MGEAQQFADFVETFAGGVIQRGAQQFVLADGVHHDQLGVAAADEEEEVGELQRGVGEVGGEGVAFDVVGCEEGNVEAHGHGFGEGAAHEEGCGEAWADCGRYRVHRGQGAGGRRG